MLTQTEIIATHIARLISKVQTEIDGCRDSSNFGEIVYIVL